MVACTPTVDFIIPNRLVFDRMQVPTRHSGHGSSSFRSRAKILPASIHFFAIDFLRENHSVLKLFTGFATAAFIAWKLTVISVMVIAIANTRPKTPKPNEVLIL
jgi:hypothetical protein